MIRLIPFAEFDASAFGVAPAGWDALDPGACLRDINSVLAAGECLIEVVRTQYPLKMSLIYSLLGLIRCFSTRDAWGLPVIWRLR